MKRIPRQLMAAITCSLVCASIGNAQESVDPRMETLTVTATQATFKVIEVADSTSSLRVYFADGLATGYANF